MCSVPPESTVGCARAAICLPTARSHTSGAMRRGSRRPMPCAFKVRWRMPLTGSATGSPGPARRQRVALLLDVALLVLLGPPVAGVHLDDVGHLLDSRVNPGSYARFQVLRRLPVRLELPERAVRRVVGREQRRPRGVVPD